MFLQSPFSAVWLRCLACSALSLLTMTPLAHADAPSIAERLSNHQRPSVFQAWGAADNLPDEDPLTSIARHDVYFSSPAAFGLLWDGPNPGTATGFKATSVPAARATRERLLQLNPDLVMLAELRHRDAWPDYLPNRSHPFWLKDVNGDPVAGWSDGIEVPNQSYLDADTWQLNLNDVRLQDTIAQQARSLMETGVVDGIMLDWWDEGDLTNQRLALVQKVRAAIGEDALIVVNTNNRQIPLSASFVNGMFMETGFDNSPEGWNRNLENLIWGEANLRKPTILLYESWYVNSRQDENIMRANATLSMVAADGYALFAEPNEVEGTDHRHDWYDFWDVEMGQAEAEGRRRADGAYERPYAKGLAIYNPPDNVEVSLQFDSKVKSVATGRIDTRHSLPAFDGDLFLNQADAAVDTIAQPQPLRAMVAGSSVSVRIEYMAEQERDLILSLQDTSTDWKTHGYRRIRAASGQQVRNVRVDINADAPAGKRYALTAYLVPRGADWPERVAASTQSELSVER